MDKYYGCFWGCTYATCNNLIGCLGSCPHRDQYCSSNCWIESTAEAQIVLDSVLTCTQDACPVCGIASPTPAQSAECDTCWSNAASPSRVPQEVDFGTAQGRGGPWGWGDPGRAGVGGWGGGGGTRNRRPCRFSKPSIGSHPLPMVCRTSGRCSDEHGGARGIRTPDLTDANRALSQLSYSPVSKCPPAGGTAGKIAMSMEKVKRKSGACPGMRVLQPPCLRPDHSSSRTSRPISADSRLAARIRCAAVIEVPSSAASAAARSATLRRWAPVMS